MSDAISQALNAIERAEKHVAELSALLAAGPFDTAELRAEYPVLAHGERDGVATVTIYADDYGLLIESARDYEGMNAQRQRLIIENMDLRAGKVSP